LWRPRTDASPVWSWQSSPVLTWRWRRPRRPGGEESSAASGGVAVGGSLIPPLVAALFVERAGSRLALTVPASPRSDWPCSWPSTRALRRAGSPSRASGCARCELFRRSPQERLALDDSWFPYAVAFGLEKDVERWFGRFGGVSRLPRGVDPLHVIAQRVQLPVRGARGLDGRRRASAAAE
jgi:hypothetical protein